MVEVKREAGTSDFLAHSNEQLILLKIEDKLRCIEATKQQIEDTATYFLELVAGEEANLAKILLIWEKMLYRMHSVKKLAFIYLANHLILLTQDKAYSQKVLQGATGERKGNFQEAFQKVIFRALPRLFDTMGGQEDYLTQKAAILKVLDVWLDKKPYPLEALKQLQTTLCSKVGLSREEIY